MKTKIKKIQNLSQGQKKKKTPKNQQTCFWDLYQVTLQFLALAGLKWRSSLFAYDLKWGQIPGNIYRYFNKIDFLFKSEVSFTPRCSSQKCLEESVFSIALRIAFKTWSSCFYAISVVYVYFSKSAFPFSENVSSFRVSF